jgi:site-specific recombinase XerD
VSKDYLEEYFSSRKLDVKGSTWTFYNHTRKRLEEYFPGRSIQSITSIEAKQFRKWLEKTNKRDMAKEGEASKGLAINSIKRRTGLCLSDIQAGDRGRLDLEESLRWDVNVGTVQ